MSEKLYTLYDDDRPIAYAYGEEWVAQALFMNDIGYPTPEDAKAAWVSGHVDGVVREVKDAAEG